MIIMKMKLNYHANDDNKKEKGTTSCVTMTTWLKYNKEEEEEGMLKSLSNMLQQ
jgi:hypothetical protein